MVKAINEEFEAKGFSNEDISKVNLGPFRCIVVIVLFINIIIIVVIINVEWCMSKVFDLRRQSFLPNGIDGQGLAKVF